MERGTDVYGLLGYPLGHSFSMSYFNEKFKQEGINAKYLNYEFKDVDEFFSKLAEYHHLRGINITIPHKETVIPYLDKIDSMATKIGAVNVIKIMRKKDDSGIITYGFNTDITGFCRSIEPMLTSIHRKALILGTGGASKAVFNGLEVLGITPTYVSRHPKAGQLSYDDLTQEIIIDNKVIVNATPLGMYPRNETYPNIPYQYITTEHISFDLVYNPDETSFMRKCAARGAKVKNGLDMLHIQAEEAWKIWNNPDV